jgi:hypothetical protein
VDLGVCLDDELGSCRAAIVLWTDESISLSVYAILTLVMKGMFVSVTAWWKRHEVELSLSRKKR